MTSTPLGAYFIYKRLDLRPISLPHLSSQRRTQVLSEGWVNWSHSIIFMSERWNFPRYKNLYYSKHRAVKEFSNRDSLSTVLRFSGSFVQRGGTRCVSCHAVLSCRCWCSAVPCLSHCGCFGWHLSCTLTSQSLLPPVFSFFTESKISFSWFVFLLYFIATVLPCLIDFKSKLKICS